MNLSDRDYLSIGEVLALLQEEFPDVTISKIRFLESQGLIEPERTHSGYRKFYGADVERLRFILREQREKYLPLRVIRDRLDAGPSEAAPEANVAAEDHAHDPSAAARADEPLGADGDGAGELELGTAGPGADAPPSHAPVPLAAVIQPAAAVTQPAAAVPAAEPHLPVWMRKAPPGVQPRPIANEAGEGDETPAHPLAPSTPEPPPAPAGSRRAAAAMLSSDASFTFDELATAAGLTPAIVRELEGFGLVSPRVVGRVSYYDGEALRAAVLAAGFLRHGIEPRHLRMYKNFVERETALFEQAILPMARQRNPSARAQATEALHELAHHGEALRALLVSQALRSLEP